MHFFAIQVKAFHFSVLLWPVWKQIHFVEYFEKAFGWPSGEGLSIFSLFLPVWKQVNGCSSMNNKWIWYGLGWIYLVRVRYRAPYDADTFGQVFWKAFRHSGESLSIFSSFVTLVETNKFGRVFWKDTWSPFRWKPFNF